MWTVSPILPQRIHLSEMDGRTLDQDGACGWFTLASPAGRWKPVPGNEPFQLETVTVVISRAACTAHAVPSGHLPQPFQAVVSIVASLCLSAALSYFFFSNESFSLACLGGMFCMKRFACSISNNFKQHLGSVGGDVLRLDRDFSVSEALAI